jgi:hypothetical protein
MNYYVYYSYEEWGRGYIGKRECRCSPEEDVNYFGSFKDKTFKPTEKIILFVCESREEVYEIERMLHCFLEVDINPHFANRSKQTSTRFSFSACGDKNPNYGGGRMPEETLKRMGQLCSERLLTWEENPFRRKGELSMSHGRVWATNTDRTEETYLKPGEQIPEGWVAGRKKYPPRSEESRNKVRNSLKGKPKSESHKEKLRQATLNYYENKKKRSPLSNPDSI